MDHGVKKRLRPFSLSDTFQVYRWFCAKCTCNILRSHCDVNLTTYDSLICVYIYHYKQMLVFVYNIYIYIPRCPLRYGVFLLPPAESTIKEREGATGTSFRVPSFPSSETLGHVWYSRRQEREHAMALRAGFGSVFWWDVLAFCWIFVVCDVCFWRSLDGIFWMSYPN